MATATKSTQHLGETAAAKNHDHDLVQHLSKMLDSVWRYDQYIANAEGKPELQQFWNELKQRDMETVRRLKELVAKEIRQDCF